MNQQILTDAEVRDIEDLYLGEEEATPAKLIRAVEALVLQRLDETAVERERRKWTALLAVPKQGPNHG